MEKQGRNVFALSLSILLAIALFLSVYLVNALMNGINAVLTSGILVVVYAIIIVYLFRMNNSNAKKFDLTKKSDLVKIMDEVKNMPSIAVQPVKQSTPKEEFVGSMQTKTYHYRNCRLAKLIKGKYKLASSSNDFFKKRKFKACKICLKRKL
jgi:hypothetical protein